MFKRAQTATEFLLTYGWALLVVLVLLGAISYIYYQNRLIPDTCFFPASLPCIDKPVLDYKHEQIKIALKNNMGYSINISNYISLNQNCNQNATLAYVNGLSLPQTIEPYQNIILTISCPGIEKGKFKTELELKYTNIDTNVEHTVKGKITGYVS